MAQVTLEQVKSVEDVGGVDKFRIVSTCSAASPSAAGSFNNSLFLFAVSDDSYQHVCTVRDVETYPESRSDAITAGQAYYRLDTVTLDFDDIEDAQEEEALQRTRIQAIVTDWDAYENEFEGTETNTYAS